MDDSYPTKVDKEENKIPVDIINDDQALALEFEKMTDAEDKGTLIGIRQDDGSYSKKNSIGEAFDILDVGNVDVERNRKARLIYEANQ